MLSAQQASRLCTQPLDGQLAKRYKQATISFGDEQAVCGELLLINSEQKSERVGVAGSTASYAGNRRASSPQYQLNSIEVKVTFAGGTDLAGCGSWDCSSGPPAMIRNGTGSYSIATVTYCRSYPIVASGVRYTCAVQARIHV